MFKPTKTDEFDYKATQDIDSPNDSSKEHFWY